ncbi:Phage minor capsid protein 2 [Streptomyces sp. cf386]|uniref:phage minor capsid protein n=1 Tax=Streptomyces sp. cf386 TaxID=1761904 RepID=UPI0008899F99|nr:phage minor capsid protein [Streptomyces sp. cf386]SDM46628.1 Phage minor capsid protein 2 [Streptomyces sp. cf386]
MPVSPAMAEDLATEVRRLYEDAEASLLERLAAALEADIESPRWAELKFAAVGDLRRAVETVSTALANDTSGAVAEALIEAYNRGRQAAVAELGALDVGRELVARRTLPNAAAVDRLAASMAEDTRPLYQRITRAVVDTFRSIVSRVSGGVLLGTTTRRQATQRALDQFASRGITGFVDRAGRSWDMAAYAEMAVRSVTARAAIEGHIDALAEIQVGLVVVSDAPLECPLCAAWEGEILTLADRSGPHTIRAEHEIEDGRTVVIHVAGSLLEARAAGLFHPNCRHSLSAYLPGVTTRPEAPPTPGTTYEDTQRQREIERHIRRWKRRAAAAMDDDARRSANAKVREWQKAMREHVAAHEHLRRKPEREQVQTARTQPSARAESTEAARLRTDPGALREMTEEQLATAMRSGRLSGEDLRRVQDEVDRRETEALLARARPALRLVDDLTGFSDDELARLLPHLNTGDVLRLAAEMDRRDADTQLPGVDDRLARMSDEQLGQLARDASGEDLAAIAAEADRRQLLAEVFPGGRLAADLSGVDEDTLGWALRYASAQDAERIAAEMDRRHPATPLPEAAGAHSVEGQLADHAAMDAILGPAGTPDDWAFLADDLPDPFEGMSSTERWIAEREAEAESARGAYTRAQVREMYREHVFAQLLAAEEATNGRLLSRKAQADGVDPVSLFTGPSHIAYARASEELKRWWEDNPRTTLAEYTEQITGQRSEAAEKARKNRGDQQNRL